MERLIHERKGYDCKYAPCQHPTKGDHGIASDEWFYVVKDGDLAVSLMVLTNLWPPTVPARVVSEINERMPMAGDITIHIGFPNDSYDGEEAQECNWVEGGKCYGMWTSALGGQAFFNKHAVPNQKEQPESFWTALEEYLQEESDSLRKSKKSTTSPGTNRVIEL